MFFFHNLKANLSWIRIRIRLFKTGSTDPDADSVKMGPDPQHWTYLYN